MPITNAELLSYPFLRGMYSDSYFPKVCVDRVKQVLVALCERIEHERPVDLAGLYLLTHAAAENGSEIETAARDAIATDFARIAAAYGFNANIETLIAPREW